MTTPSEKGRPIYSIEDLGLLIKEKRDRDNLTLVEADQQSGVSKATLSRLERQHTHQENLEMRPDTRTIKALANWLGIPAQHFFGAEIPMTQERSGGMSLPEAVEAHLRADKNLEADAAEKLSMMFRLAYEQFSKPANRPPNADK